MTNLIGKRIRINENYSDDEFKGIEGTIIFWRGDGWCDAEMHLDDKTAKFTLIEEWFDVIEEDNMASMVGKQVVRNGKKGVVLEESEDTLFVEFDNYSSYLSKHEVAAVGDVVWQYPQDSLKDLQKLCTTNNIHILISKNDYQIWDEHSDDTYEMDSVDDVIKAIECLNELKQWRQ